MDNRVLEILLSRNGDEFDKFCDQIQGRIDDKNLIKDLVSLRAFDKKYSALKMLAWIFFAELSGRNFGETAHFHVSEYGSSFQRYMYKWNILGVKNIPFKEWSDLAEEGVKLLELLISEDKLIGFEKNVRYKNFIKKFVERHEELRLKRGYNQLNELMDN